MTIRASRNGVHEGKPVLSVDFIGEESIERFTKMVNASMNCTWEEANAEMRDLADLLTHGKVMPSNRCIHVEDDRAEIPASLYKTKESAK